MTNVMKNELNNLRNHILESFKDDYEPNSYDDDNLSRCIFDMCERETIYTVDAENLIKAYPLSINYMFMESKSYAGKVLIDFPVSSEKIVQDALIYYCLTYMYSSLLKLKQNIDGGK